MFKLVVIGLLSLTLSACAGPFWWGPGSGPGRAQSYQPGDSG